LSGYLAGCEEDLIVARKSDIHIRKREINLGGVIIIVIKSKNERNGRTGGRDFKGSCPIAEIENNTGGTDTEFVGGRARRNLNDRGVVDEERE
jgi:hypothetical protein